MTTDEIADIRQIVDDKTFEFHKEEFNNLKREIDTFGNAISSNLKYSITISGIIFTWLFIYSKENNQFNTLPLALVWFLPAAISAAFLLLSVSMHLHVREIGKYILKIEERYAYPGLGWELYYSTHNIKSKYIYGISWVLIIFCDVFLAIFVIITKNKHVDILV